MDPLHPYLQSDRSRARQLSELAEYRALVLLGEPGIGKSTTLMEEAARFHAAANDDRITSIHVDLRAYSSEVLLHKRVFESTEFIAWEKGDTHLVLHLDSLDEALLRIDSIANLLTDELPRHPTNRLSVRIACRTAVWPSGTLDPSYGKFGGSWRLAFRTGAFTSMRRGCSCRAYRHPWTKLFRRTFYCECRPFAIKPLTLNMLLALFKKNGQLPRSISEIYLHGCLKLCEEQNYSRRDAGRLGVLSATQRLRVASRIATATMFANRYAVWTGPEGDDFPEEDIPLSALAGNWEDGDFPSFEVSEQNVSETLDTGLFTSRGSDRMGWAHQSYAEFLAAQYLDSKEILPRTNVKMVQHPSGEAVPQLSVVAAWSASINRDVRKALIQSEPIVLLQGDFTSWDELDLSELTASLLLALDENRAFDLRSARTVRTVGPREPGFAASCLHRGWLKNYY